MEILSAIEKRCSVRKFEERQLDKEALQLILEAARMAPTGKNDRKAKLYVFQEPTKLAALDEVLKRAAFAGNADGIPVEKAGFMKKEGYQFCYHAPTFVLVTYERGNYNALANTGCILENAMLQATELGVGSCWINMGRRCDKDEELRHFLEPFGFTVEEEITGGLALGYPAAEPVKNAKTEGNTVIYV